MTRPPCAVCGVSAVHHSKWASRELRDKIYAGHLVDDPSSVSLEELYER